MQRMYAHCDFCDEPIYDDPTYRGGYPLHKACREQVEREIEEDLRLYGSPDEFSFLDRGAA